MSFYFVSTFIKILKGKYLKVLIKNYFIKIPDFIKKIEKYKLNLYYY